MQNTKPSKAPSPFFLIIVLVALIVGSYIYVRVVGDEFTAWITLYDDELLIREFEVRIADDCCDCVEIQKYWKDGDKIFIKLKSKYPGKTFLQVDSGDYISLLDVYVHRHRV